MPGFPGNPPGILTPGRGPNGPGPIDARKPVTGVGIGISSVPYGPTLGYAASNNGVTGFVGPAAGSLRRPKSLYVRVGGANTNGGDSAQLAAERSGSDGVMNNTTTFTSATAAFTSADVGRILAVNALHMRINSVTNATTVILTGVPGNGAGTAWAIGGALATLGGWMNGSQATVGPGDTIYIGAGTYREILVNTIPPVNTAGFPVQFNGRINVVGDVTGQFTGDAGMVQLTGYTTNDKTVPSASSLINFAGKSNLEFSNIFFVNSQAVLLQALSNSTQNLRFTDCAFFGPYQGSTRIVNVQTAYATPLAWRFDRCIFNQWGLGANMFLITLLTGNGPDYDANFEVKNSLVLYSGQSQIVSVANQGTLTGKGGGFRLTNSTVVGATTVLITVASQNSIIFPCIVTGCLIQAANQAAVSAGTSGQIIESYNLFIGSVPRTNVAVGAGSISDGSYNPLYHFGQERIYADPVGVPLFKPYGEPMQSSPLLGFGARDPLVSLGAVDLLNLPRPAGLNSSLPAVGALERHNNWVSDPAPIGDGSTPIKFTGPGDQAFIVPVPARPITVTVKVAWDAAYQGTKPQLQLQANSSIGVAGQTATAVGSGTVETLTVGPFTPTAGGKQVVIRLRSNDLTGTSVVQADQFTVTG